MSLMLIAALQAAAPAAPAHAPMVRTDFDLADMRPAERTGLTPPPDCRRSSADEILVCGRRPRRDDYPIEAMARLFAPQPIVAEMALGGGTTGRAFVDSVTLDRGAVSNRIMFGITLPF